MPEQLSPLLLGVENTYQLNRTERSMRRFAEPPPPPNPPNPPLVERERPNDGEVSDPTGELRLTVLNKF